MARWAAWHTSLTFWPVLSKMAKIWNENRKRNQMALNPVPFPSPASDAQQLEQVASSLITQVDAGTDNRDPAPQPDVRHPEPEDMGHPADADAQDDLAAQGEDPGEPDEPDNEIAEHSPEGDVEDFELSDDVLIEVKVNGQFKDVTLRELKRGYSGQDAILQGNEEIAQARKQVEAIVTQATQVRDAYAQKLAQLEAENQDADPNIDWEGLEQADPQEWMRQREKHRQRQEARAARQHELQQVQTEQHQSMQARQAMYLQEQANIIREHIPELADPEQGPALRARLEKHAQKFGFTAEDLQQVNDARAFRLLYGSMMAEEGSVGEKVNKTKQRRVRPKVRPGKAPTPRSRGQRQQKQKDRQRQRAIETGHPDDVAKTLF